MNITGNDGAVSVAWPIDQNSINDIISRLSDRELQELLTKLNVSNVETLLGLFVLPKMNVRPYEEFLMDHIEFRMHKYLSLYVPPILVVIGTLGNILSCIILLRGSMTKISTYIYLAVLAVIDTIVLYTGLLRIWIGQVSGWNITEQSTVACKLLQFLGYSASDSSVYMIVAVTVERYIAVVRPLRASVLCNTRRAIMVILGILGLILTINAHFLWTVEVVYYPIGQDKIPKCDGAKPYQTFVETWAWIDAFIYSFLPFVIIMILNTLIIRQVIFAHRNRELMTNCGNHDSTMSPQSRPQSYDGGYKITIMLLTISFAFLVTTLPMNICMIVGALLNKDSFNTNTIVKFTLAKTITELLMYVNHSMNFFLYCATGQKFRHQLIRLFWCCGKTSRYRCQLSENTMSVNGGHRFYKTSDETEMFDMNKQTKQSLLKEPL